MTRGRAVVDNDGDNDVSPLTQAPTVSPLGLWLRLGLLDLLLLLVVVILALRGRWSPECAAAGAARSATRRSRRGGDNAVADRGTARGEARRGTLNSGI